METFPHRNPKILAQHSKWIYTESQSKKSTDYDTEMPKLNIYLGLKHSIKLFKKARPNVMINLGIHT